MSIFRNRLLSVAFACWIQSFVLLSAAVHWGLLFSLCRLCVLIVLLQNACHHRQLFATRCIVQRHNRGRNHTYVFMCIARDVCVSVYVCLCCVCVCVFHRVRMFAQTTDKSAFSLGSLHRFSQPKRWLFAHQTVRVCVCACLCVCVFCCWMCVCVLWVPYCVAMQISFSSSRPLAQRANSRSACVLHDVVHNFRSRFCCCVWQSGVLLCCSSMSVRALLYMRFP